MFIATSVPLMIDAAAKYGIVRLRRPHRMASLLQARLGIKAGCIVSWPL
jgi:hypothetical protein